MAGHIERTRLEQVETAWAKRCVSRSPRNGWTVSRSEYQVISASNAGSERNRVRFMLVIRPTCSL